MQYEDREQGERADIRGEVRVPRVDLDDDRPKAPRRPLRRPGLRDSGGSGRESRKSIQGTVSPGNR